MEKRYSCHEVAANYGVKVNTVWTWIRQKKLPAIRIGKQYFITAENLQEFESVHKTK